ncbi:hypothetical protein K435DRAFT_858619 [Dendrothele bispora CBS 962.96]|uniref:Uncharacterized protein n=1 Tax=Dendrothele bispora (strain CBS 962.96) TaxID=1314807 RepID=A0A4S8M3C9_DENBC|nr:hypothetical protein K435DRAFT_858619 [Dendrothele bispora CBS 962.96]
MSPSVEETVKRKAPTGSTKSQKRKKVDYTKFTQIDMTGISAPNSLPLPEHGCDSNKAIPISHINSSQDVQLSDVAKTSTNIIPASGDETESDQLPLQAPSVTIFSKKQPFQTGIENIKTAPRVNKTKSTIQPTTLPSEAHTEPDVPKHQPSHNQPFVAEVTSEKTVQGGIDTQEEAELLPKNLMMSLNDSSGVEIVDLPESTNLPSESDTGNQLPQCHLC